MSVKHANVQGGGDLFFPAEIRMELENGTVVSAHIRADGRIDGDVDGVLAAHATLLKAQVPEHGVFFAGLLPCLLLAEKERRERDRSHKLYMVD